jgi:hypothetical protein
MTTEQVSIRMPKETLRRLDAESKRERVSRSELARAFIEEALRMEAHRGIVFKPGPAGRRPALAAGPDVWEIVRAWHDLGVPEAEAIPRLAAIAAVSEHEIQTALTYYVAYPEEIDAWIAQVNVDTERAFAEWERRQATPEA